MVFLGEVFSKVYFEKKSGEEKIQEATEKKMKEETTKFELHYKDFED